MKFNFTVDIDDCDDGYDLQSEILSRATDAFIDQILGRSWDKDSMSSQLKTMIENKVNEICNKDFKETVCNTLAERLTDKVETSNQYKKMIKTEEIYSDSQIKIGLRNIVSQLVKSEMKKVFNN